MESINKEKFKKNQAEILKLKSTITKNSLYELSSGCELSQERFGELEDRLVTITQAENRGTQGSCWHQGIQVPAGRGEERRRRVFEKPWLKTSKSIEKQGPTRPGSSLSSSREKTSQEKR